MQYSHQQQGPGPPAATTASDTGQSSAASQSLRSSVGMSALRPTRSTQAGAGSGSHFGADAPDWMRPMRCATSFRPATRACRMANRALHTAGNHASEGGQGHYPWPPTQAFRQQSNKPWSPAGQTGAGESTSTRRRAAHLQAIANGGSPDACSTLKAKGQAGQLDFRVLPGS